MMTPEILRLDLEIEGHRESRFIALDESRSEVIGILSLKGAEHKAASVYQLFVVEPFRHCGIGTQLIATACQVASTQGATMLSLLVSENDVGLINYYEHLGFLPVWSENRQLLMSKTLR